MRIISEQELKDILDKHGKWLIKENGGERADLRSADLRYANLSSANLSYADLSYADLRYANLSYADLRSANLSSANLRSANLRYADLRSANLRYADLSSADLSYADLSSADLMIFQFQRHQAFYSLDDNLRIGCLYLPLDEWVNKFEEIGKREQYSDLQIKVYGSFIKMCAEMQLTKSDRIVGVGDDE